MYDLIKLFPEQKPVVLISKRYYVENFERNFVSLLKIVLQIFHGLTFEPFCVSFIKALGWESSVSGSMKFQETEEKLRIRGVRWLYIYIYVGTIIMCKIHGTRIYIEIFGMKTNSDTAEAAASADID